ncbi:hypothetical protein JFV29_19985 [Peribacillus sp. TH16]|nr:hypothetical protein [Peribacillus sp. TH16]MBK5484125.1 hypothetical protein [Peribacillus sp. TH16]
MLPILTLTVELASALSVTFVVLSPNAFTIGFVGAVLSSTSLGFDTH